MSEENFKQNEQNTTPRQGGAVPNGMRILIVTPLVPPEPGGPSYYSVGLRDALQQKDHDAVLLAFKEVRQYPTVIRHIIFFFKVCKQALGVDSIIVLDTVSVALPAVLAGKLLGKKTIVRVGGDFVWERFVERTQEKVLLSEFYTKDRALSFKERLLVWLQKHLVLRSATHIVFNTEWQRKIWRIPYHIPDQKTSVIGNAVKKSERVYRGGTSFLCVWRPTAFKNTDTLERAYDLAKKKYPQMGLDIFKNIPREELYSHLEHARALIIPSLSELSPNMALEALGMGVPVLLTEDCGVHDLLDGVVTWVDPRSPEDIAEKMCALMDESVYLEAKRRVGDFSFTHTYDEICHKFLTT